MMIKSLLDMDYKIINLEKFILSELKKSGVKI